MRGRSLHRSINTRNRPRQEIREGGGPVAAIVALNDACRDLEGLGDTYAAVRQSPQILGAVNHAVQLIYKACTIVEKSAMSTDLQEKALLGKQGTLLDQPAARPQEEAHYLSDGLVDGGRLYKLARAVGPWECGTAICRKCPHGGESGPESQRHECLSYYLAEQTKRVALDELAAGVPYTQDELGSLGRRDLTKLLHGVFRINRYKIKDKTTRGLIRAVLQAQSELADREGTL